MDMLAKPSSWRPTLRRRKRSRMSGSSSREYSARATKPTSPCGAWRTWPFRAGSPVPCVRISNDFAGLIERQARIAREQGFGGSAAECANEVRFDRSAREKGGVDFRIVEAGHRTAIQAERARRQDQIGALKRGVAHHMNRT